MNVILAEIDLADGNNYPTKHTNWKIEYLKQVYPYISNPSEQNFDDLEMYYTNFLPAIVQQKLSEKVYKAALPGPSCLELPCDCVNGSPDVNFSPNPMLDNGWPFCNLPGKEGEKCCESVENYKQCFLDGKVPWAANDTWTGNEKNIDQPPPCYNQLWKPTLWPKYTLAVSKYNENNWNDFYNVKGDPSYSWIEGLHSSFSIVNSTYGVWFYKAKGSGMFVNLGKTYANINKLDAILKLMDMDDFIDFILRENNGDVLTDKVDINSTGLGGFQNLQYWLNGGFQTNLDNELKEAFGKNNISRDDVKRFLYTAAYGKNYRVGRLANTGVLDHLIIVLARKFNYHSVQFTVQSNVWTGWTTEIMILGNSPKIYTSIEDIPYEHLKVLDPNRLTIGHPECSNINGAVCTYTSGFSCLYCNESPITKNCSMNCTQDITNFKTCPVPPSHPSHPSHPGSTGHPGFKPHNAYGGPSGHPGFKPHNAYGGPSGHPGIKPHNAYGGPSGHPGIKPHGGSSGHPGIKPHNAYGGSSGHPGFIPHGGSSGHPGIKPYNAYGGSTGHPGLKPYNAYGNSTKPCVGPHSN